MGGSFNALWSGQSISLLGDFIAYFTVPRYVLELTTNASAFTTIYAFENLPTLLFGFVGGVLVDRWNRRRMAIVSDIVRAVAFVGLAYLVSIGELEIWMLVVISFLVGSMAASFNAALMSFVPSVVGMDRLATANSRLAISQQVAFAIGPALGALILELTGSFPITFLINAATFVVSAISLVLARPSSPQTMAGSEGFRRQLVDGLRFLWEDRMLRWTVLAGSAANFVVAFVESTLVLVSREVLGVTEDVELGLIFAALGLGGVLGALTATKVIRRLKLGRTFVVGFFIFGAGLLGLANQREVIVIMASVFVGFVGLPWINVSLVTIRQLRSPDEMLGRITAASRAVAWGSLPIGALIAGFLADDVVGLDTMLFAGPFAMFLIGALLILSPVWRTTSVETSVR